MKYKESFLKSQLDLAESEQTFAGCTANVVLISHKTNIIYCANVGDSRTILFSGNDVVRLSYDHKPEDEIEKSRIENAGGSIVDGRINSIINLSRAIGDLEFKKNEELSQKEQ